MEIYIRNLSRKIIRDITPLCLCWENCSIILEKIDLRAKNELDRLVPLLAEQQGVTEQLKAENQLKWVGLMNNIKAQVEEIIYVEIVYVR